MTEPVTRPGVCCGAHMARWHHVAMVRPVLTGAVAVRAAALRCSPEPVWYCIHVWADWIVISPGDRCYLNDGNLVVVRRLGGSVLHQQLQAGAPHTDLKCRVWNPDAPAMDMVDVRLRGSRR